MLLSLIASASVAGSWCGVVGIPTLNPRAAWEQGIVLDRLALIPHPGNRWAEAVSMLLEGFDIVVIAPPGPIPEEVACELAARARQTGGVLLSYGLWWGADVTLAVVGGSWHGLGNGRGRLRWRELTVRAWWGTNLAVSKDVRCWRTRN